MTLHKVTSDMFPENPDKWGRELSEQIELQMFLMQIYFKAINEQEFNLQGENDFAGIPRLQNVSINDRRELLKLITLNDTFLSYFRELVVFIDKMLSLHLCAEASRTNPIPGNIYQNIFAELVREQYINFTRQNVNFPTKIEMLDNLNPKSKERLLAYNDIRISFEHHGGICKKKIALPLSTIELCKGQDGIQKAMVKFDRSDRKEFKRDQLIIFKPQDVEIIGADIKGLIIKDILLSIGSMNN